jgi:hypothetical protein
MTFQIGDKVFTIKGKKIYTIKAQDQYGNFVMVEGGKFAGSYLRAAKVNAVADFFAKASEIEWEAK